MKRKNNEITKQRKIYKLIDEVHDLVADSFDYSISDKPSIKHSIRSLKKAKLRITKAELLLKSAL